MKRIIKLKNVRILICNSINYATHAAIAARIAVANKIPLLIADDQFKIFRKIDNLNKDLFQIEMKNINYFLKNSKQIDFKKYLKKRYSGMLKTSYTSRSDVAIANKNKINLDKKKFLLKYFNNRKFQKIALITPHAFTDAVHGAGKRFIFENYYEQFVQTIEYIYNYKKNDILWVIKPHPRSKDYKEEGQVEEVLKKFKKNNIILLDKKISTLSAIKISDLIITGRGSIGLEASSLGKKVIIAGYAVYEKLGFTIEPKNKKKYFFEIINPKNYNPLEKSKILKARKYLYYFDNVRSYNLPKSQLEILTPGEFYYKDFFKRTSNFMLQKKYLKDNYYLSIDKILSSIKLF